VATAYTLTCMNDLYRRWLDELWNGSIADLEKLAADRVTPDFVGNWPLRPGLVHGPDELARIIREGREMFDDLAFSTEVGPMANGDLVAARWVARGHYRGSSLEFRGHDILRVTEDRFSEYWVLSEDISDLLTK
jgi:hypothetical protein